MYYLTAEKRLLVSTFLEGLIFGGCNPVITAFSAYGWILQESGPYPITRSRTRASLIRELAEILQLSRDFLSAHVELNRSVRLLGITISNLAHPQSFQQLTLDLSSSERCGYGQLNSTVVS